MVKIMTLKLFPIRLEEYQIEELKNRIPERQISKKLRELVAIYLDIQDTGEERLIELNEKVHDLDKQKQIILNEIESINSTTAKITKESELDSMRSKYIIDNPNTIQMYKKGIITAKGYKILVDKLSFKSKIELTAFLDSYLEK